MVRDIVNKNFLGGGRGNGLPDGATVDSHEPPYPESLAMDAGGDTWVQTETGGQQEPSNGRQEIEHVGAAWGTPEPKPDPPKEQNLDPGDGTKAGRNSHTKRK